MTYRGSALEELFMAKTKALFIFTSAQIVWSMLPSMIKSGYGEPTQICGNLSSSQSVLKTVTRIKIQLSSFQGMF